MAQEQARVHPASPVEIDHLLLAVVRMHDDHRTKAGSGDQAGTPPA